MNISFHNPLKKVKSKIGLNKADKAGATQAAVEPKGQEVKEEAQISEAARGSRPKKNSKLGSRLLRGLGYAAGITAAVVGGASGAVGAAVGAVVGAGVGAVVNAVRNFDIYRPSKMNLGLGARRGAAAGAAIGGVIGATVGTGGVAIAGGAGALVVGGAAVGTIALLEGTLYNK